MFFFLAFAKFIVFEIYLLCNSCAFQLSLIVFFFLLLSKWPMLEFGPFEWNGMKASFALKGVTEKLLFFLTINKAID